VAFANDTSAPYQASLDTTKMANGQYTLMVKATDSSGASITNQITVCISNSDSGQERDNSLQHHSWERTHERTDHEDQNDQVTTTECRSDEGGRSESSSDGEGGSTTHSDTGTGNLDLSVQSLLVRSLWMERTI
jgi:hypothetical protein